MYLIHLEKEEKMFSQTMRISENEISIFLLAACEICLLPGGNPIKEM